MSKEKLGEDIIFTKRKIIIKILNIIYYIFISYLFVSNLSIECKQRRIQSNDLIIYLKVNGPGNISILSSDFEYLPSEICINNIIQNVIYKYYYFNNSENNVTLKWENKLNSTCKMFKGCLNITEIDFSNFDTSNVKNMESMFEGCTSLISLNLSNFKTSNVNNMFLMFANCSSLTYLNLDNFDTLNVNRLNCMFEGCSSLKSLNLSNFKTPNVVLMDYMFMQCSSLISLDLSNFDTSKVEKMNGMFQDCFSLVSLDLSNFNLLNINSLDKIFYNCFSMSYLSLNNLDILKDSFLEKKIFEGCSSLKFILFKTTNINNDLVNNILNSTLKNITICSDVHNNVNFHFEIEEERICNNFSFTDYRKNVFKCYSKFIPEEYYKYSCGICGDNFFQIYDDKNNNISYINCYNSPEGYFLDLKESIYKSCYFSCKACDKNGNEIEHN